MMSRIMSRITLALAVAAFALSGQSAIAQSE